MLSFLRYYVRLRVNALLGRHTTSRPLGLRYRWRQWQYTQHLKWLKERAWIDEASAEEVTEPRPKAQRNDREAARRAA